MKLKRPVSWTIDKDILDMIDKDAEEQKRSASFIVNEHLIKIYKEEKCQ